MCLYGIMFGTIIHCSKETHSFNAYKTSSNMMSQYCQRKIGLAEASLEVHCVFGRLNTRFIILGRRSHSVLTHKTSQGLKLNTNQGNTLQVMLVIFENIYWNKGNQCNFGNVDSGIGCTTFALFPALLSTCSFPI